MSLNSNSKVYKTLKPIVNDHTKLCKKGHKNHDKCTRQPEEIKIKFTKENKFEINNFILHNINEDLRCIVCKLLFDNPITCYKCNTSFCTQCITKQLELHSKCPKCYQLIFIDLMKPDLAHEKEYNSPFKCPHKDCHEVFLLKDLNRHLENCLFVRKRSEYLDKLIYNDNHANDPNMQKDLFDYMRGLTIYQPNKQNVEFKTDLKVNELIKKNNEMKLQFKKFNEYANKTMVDMFESSKVTNCKIKLKK